MRQLSILDHPMYVQARATRVSVDFQHAEYTLSMAQSDLYTLDGANIRCFSVSPRYRINV